ncbi:sulfotransferase [Stanieria cyanosphaera PCC 7437]|uniref:Sulfotransferase n=1 Tax=Stanieria cyanosphaera (strain ATCC 29371 / PCC 7437) TaxID=111780 RepID=K9XTC1_STAC7|nr:sulfotransferase [Stanieria cyanosphaera]AFZ35783.1 sulfotransferase [Stanieria cyanosphaera PCC 7437]
MLLPNFIFAGAPKSASSTLFEYIKQHPDIYMCPIKEPFFFDFNYEKGIDWYQSLFSNYQGEKIIGEATVWYMRWKSVPQRIYQTIPNSKFLFVLRNPIERAFSNYQMDLFGGKYTLDQTFGYVIRNEFKDSSIDRTIVSSGFYYEQLKRFEEYFDPSNFLIILYEDLKNDLRAVEKKIYEFLDVDSNFQAINPDNRMIGRCLKNEKLLIKLSQLPGFNKIWQKHRQFRKLFIYENSTINKQKIATMSKEDREYLNFVYAKHNDLLSKYINQDLSHWQ